MGDVVEFQSQQWDESIHILDLPLEIQNHIFQFFTAKELYASVNLVCQEWRDLATQELQWKRLCRRDFGFLVSTFELKKPRMLTWRLWWKFLALDGLMFFKEYSSPALKLTKKHRSYVARCRRHERAATFPFPPPHKIARTQLALKEGEYNYFEVFIAGIGSEEGNGKANEQNLNSEVGVGVVTSKAKVNEFLGQNQYGGGYYNNGAIGYSGKFAPVLRPKKDDEIEDEDEEEMEDTDERVEEELQGTDADSGEPTASNGEHSGHSSIEEEEELENASPFATGDIVGVLVDLKTSKRRMGFFVNGEFQGFHYSNLPAETEFYPSVSLKSYGSKVIVHPLLTHSATFAIDGEDVENIE